MIINKVSFGQIQTRRIPYGTDYKTRELVELTPKEIRETNKASKTNSMTEEMKLKLVQGHFSLILSTAEKFVNEHPEHDIDDVTQELMLIALQCSENYVSREGLNFNRLFSEKAESYLKKLSKTPEVETIQYGRVPKYITDYHILERQKRAINREVTLKILDEALTKREKEIVLKRYGFNDGIQKTNQEVGNDYGIGGNRISQFDRKSRYKLVRPKHKELVEKFFDNSVPFSLEKIDDSIDFQRRTKDS